MIEVQCTSCHTRYRIDEQVLPEGTPTFKCSRCGHVFSVDPRRSEKSAQPHAASRQGPQRMPRMRAEPKARPRADESATEQPSKVSPSPSDGVPGVSERHESPTRAQTEQKPDATAAPAEAPAPKGPSTEELLARVFEHGRHEAKPADNPGFEFKEEPGPREEIAAETPAAAAQWETATGPDFSPLPIAPEAQSTGLAAATVRPSVERDQPVAITDPSDFMREEATAPVYNQAVTHSARFFLLLFLIVGLGFGTMTLAIHNAAAGAADILSRFPMIGDRFTPATIPARLVALRDVHADYQRTRSGQIALVITGTAENVGLRPLHVVQIAVGLRQRGGPSATSKAVYCGNNLSPRMLSQMTPHEIEFLQKLDPPKSFSLVPSASCPFVIVFIDPPAGLNGFDISVTRAIAAAGQTPQPEA